MSNIDQTNAQQLKEFELYQEEIQRLREELSNFKTDYDLLKIKYDKIVKENKL